MHRGVTNLLNWKKILTWTTSNCLQKMKKNWRLIQAMRISSHDIEIEYGLEKMSC